MSRSSISNADTDEAIGEFWDTHDLADFWDRTHEVEYEFVVAHRVSVATDLYELLEAEAARQRVTPETMANIILSEVLKSSGYGAYSSQNRLPQSVIAEQNATYYTEESQD